MSRLFLKVLNTPLLGTELTLNPPGGILGRSRTAEVSIRHAGLSGQHARLQWDATQGWLIADAGSTNGTWLNGEPLNQTLRPLGTRARVSCADLELNVWVEPVVAPIQVESAPETVVHGVSLLNANGPNNASPHRTPSVDIPAKPEAAVVRPSSQARAPQVPSVLVPATPPRSATDAVVGTAAPGPVPVSLMREPSSVSLMREPSSVSLMREPSSVSLLNEPPRAEPPRAEPPRAEPPRAEPARTTKPVQSQTAAMPETVGSARVQASPPVGVESAPETREEVIVAYYSPSLMASASERREGVIEPFFASPRVESAPETREEVISAPLSPPRVEPLRPDRVGFTPETRVEGVAATVLPPRGEPPRPDRVEMEPPLPRWESAPVQEGQALRALLREGRALADALGESLEVLAHGLSTGVHRERLEQTVEEASLRLADFRSRLNDSLGGPR